MHRLTVLLCALLLCACPTTQPEEELDFDGDGVDDPDDCEPADPTRSEERRGG